MKNIGELSAAVRKLREAAALVVETEAIVLRAGDASIIATWQHMRRQLIFCVGELNLMREIARNKKVVAEASEEKG